jgi:hypothetical protein
MRLKKLAIRGLIAAVLVIGFSLTVITNSYATPKRHASKAPSTEQVAFAERTSELMFQTVLAALLQEFKQTNEEAKKPHPSFAEGNQSISLIFNDANRDMRLIGTVGPLRENDRPSDAFEVKANNLALTTGKPLTDVQKVDGKWYYRRSVPLTNFDPSCALCHINYKGFSQTEKVGALVLRVPIVATYKK